jgi:hypothetical protein
MRFGLFWQTPGSAESSVARWHWETIEEIVLSEQLGFETAWLAEDEPAVCVERLQSLQAQLPSMYQCILESNRCGRIPSARIQESMRLFADQVIPQLCTVPAAS